MTEKMWEEDAARHDIAADPRSGRSLRDFLADATVASRQLVDVERQVDVIRVPHSLCLQTGRENDELNQLFQDGRKVMIRFVALGCLMLVCLFGLATYLSGVPAAAPNRWALVVAAIICLVVGCAFFVLAAMGNGWQFRKTLLEQTETYQGELSAVESGFVEIEYPSEFESTDEPVVSDAGFLYSAAEQNRVIIEGVLLRHVIRSQDVIDIRAIETETVVDEPAVSLRIKYRIGDHMVMVIGIHHDSLLADFLQKYFRREPMIVAIESVLKR